MSQFAQYEIGTVGNLKSAIESCGIVANHQDIREICTRLIMAHEGEEFQAALTELKLAICEQVADADNRRTGMIVQVPRNGTDG